MKLKPLGHIALNWVLPLAILIGAAVAVKMLGTQQKTGRKKAPPQVSIPVDIVKAELHQGPLTISASGVVVPFREVDLPTEIGGRIIWKSDSLLPGKYVNQGDELLKIDSADYQLEVDRLEQQVTKANSDLARATIDIENARRLIVLAEETLELRKREVSRMKMLRQNRASSNAEYDAAEKSYVEAKQSLTVQENSLRSLEADRESLKSAKELAFQTR